MKETTFTIKERVGESVIENVSNDENKENEVNKTQRRRKYADVVRGDVDGPKKLVWSKDTK